MNIKTIFILIFLLGISNLMSSQTVNPKTVDVKSLSNTQVKKVQEAIESSGASNQDVINMARQRGATEQQINDMQLRLQQLESGSGKDNQIQIDPLIEASKEIELQEDSEQSTRKAPIKSSISFFGAYLFNSTNLTFEPNLNIQTPKDYEIGIGDELIINIWGSSQQNYQVRVNRNGQIIIPDLGPIYVAGLSLENTTLKIKQRLTSIYSGMSGDKPTAFAQINLGQLRSIKINILGEVTIPGTYTLPVTATLFNALYLSGGPTNIGSFRHIKVIRNNKVYKTIDLYKFLIDADPDDNILLSNEDIIFIPTLEKSVTVKGEFKRNLSFEMLHNETLEDAIKYAGGFTDDSYLHRLKIYRKTQQGVQINDITFDEISTTLLKNGDQISIGKTSEVFENRLTITGAVYRPGEYEWYPEMTLMNLIKRADSITADAYLKRGTIIRFKNDLSQELISFNLSDILTGTKSITLYPEDIINIKSRFELEEERYITMMGEVKNPGRITYIENMTLGDALYLSDGLRISADTSYLEISRQLSFEEAAVAGDKLRNIFNLRIPRDLNKDLKELQFKLEAYDQISVRKAPNYEEQGQVKIIGEVVFGGSFSLSNKQLRISDLVKLSGGITAYAYSKGATFQRNTAELGKEFIAIELPKILANPGSSNDLYLRSGDLLTIPKELQTVKIIGAVQNPISVTYEEGKSLKYYINQSGGFQTKALKRKAYVRYQNGKTKATHSFLYKTYPKIEPGSEIIIPLKPERAQNDNSGKWLAFASVLSSLAIAFATIFK